MRDKVEAKAWSNDPEFRKAAFEHWEAGIEHQWEQNQIERSHHDSACSDVEEGDIRLSDFEF